MRLAVLLVLATVCVCCNKPRNTVIEGYCYDSVLNIPLKKVTVVAEEGFSNSSWSSDTDSTGKFYIYADGHKGTNLYLTAYSDTHYLDEEVEVKADGKIYKDLFLKQHIREILVNVYEFNSPFSDTLVLKKAYTACDSLLTETVFLSSGQWHGLTLSCGVELRIDYEIRNNGIKETGSKKIDLSVIDPIDFYL